MSYTLEVDLAAQRAEVTQDEGVLFVTLVFDSSEVAEALRQMVRLAKVRHSRTEIAALVNEALK